MSVKISSFEIENVKRVKAVKLEPSESGLTVIGGNNGQGKTSVLDAIAWALGGDRFAPSSPKRAGSTIPPHLTVKLNNGIIVERKGKNSDLILTRLRTQHEDRYFMDFYTPRPVVRRTPLILVIGNYEKEHTPDLITSLFELIITIAKICTGSNIQKADYRPLSPDLRAEIINLDRTLEEYHFLCDQFINCAQDFVEYRAEIVGKIESYEAERQHIRNQIRRAKTPEEDYSLKEKCREITKKLTPLRKQLKICERIEKKVPRLRALIEQEKQLEQGRYKYKYYQNQKKERGYTR